MDKKYRIDGKIKVWRMRRILYGINSGLKLNDIVTWINSRSKWKEFTRFYLYRLLFCKLREIWFDVFYV
jgi:hypothetical protein